MTAARYDFRAEGANDVVAAFRGVTAAAEKAANDEVKARERAMKHVAAIRDRYFRDQQRQEERAAKIAERQALAQQRAQQRVTSSNQRAAERSAANDIRQRERAMAHVARIRDRHFQNEQKQQERALAHVARIRERHLLTEQRQRERVDRANERVRSERLRTLTNIGASAAGRVWDVTKGAALAGGGIVTGLVGAAARESLQIGDLAKRAAINARLAGETVDEGALKRSFESTALAQPGVSAQGVGEAFLAYQSKTGKAANAGMLGVFAQTAAAGGGDIKDIAAAAASLTQQFDIKGIEEMREALAALTVQGAKGSFEIKDAASQFDKMGSAARRFGLDKGPRGVALLGGLSQLARTSTGSAEEATTAVEHLFSELIKHSPELERDNVKVFEDKDKTRTRDFVDIFKDMLVKTGGSLPAMEHYLGERGIRGGSALINAFNEAKNRARGTDEEKTAAGLKAFDRALDDVINTTAAVSAVQAAAASASESSSAILSNAWETLVASTSEELVPAIRELAPELPALAHTIGGAAGAFADAAHIVGGAFKQLQEMGLVEGPEATKAIHGAAGLKTMDAEIATLEKKGGRTEKEEERLSRMKDMRNAYVQAHGDEMLAPLQEAAGPRGRGFKASQVPITPLEGMSAVAAIKTPESEEKPSAQRSPEVQSFLDSNLAENQTKQAMAAVGATDAIKAFAAAIENAKSAIAAATGPKAGST